jgi:prophage tail gpP-like protein
MGLLPDEFKLTAVADWRAVLPSLEADTRLIVASLDERDRATGVLDPKADQTAIESERAKVAEVVEGIQHGNAAFHRMASKEIDLALKQRLAVG